MGSPRFVRGGYSELQRRGFPKASRYFEEIEEQWNKHRTTKQKDTSIYKWINYRNKITSQNLKMKFKVLYVASSTYLASCVINQQDRITFKTNTNELILNGFVAESKTYHLETNNEDEAHFLCAVLNSKAIDELIKPLQTRGLWGPRDIHKRPLSLPIPLYNKQDQKHVELSQLSKKCHKQIPEHLLQITSKKIGNIRSEIRKKVEEELKQIDILTKEILIAEDPKIKDLIF